MRGSDKTTSNEKKRGIQLTNEQQLWLMKQVKLGEMTIDEAVEYKKNLEEGEYGDISLDDEDQLQTNRDGTRRSSTTKFLIKLFSKRNKTKREAKEKAASVSDDGHTDFPSNDNLTAIATELKEKKIFNFSVYKTAKHKGSQRRILQLDFELRVIVLINRGNFLKKFLFSTLVQAGGRDGKKVSMYFDDNEEFEIDAENLADKTKILRFLNLIVDQNEYEERGDEFDPQFKLQSSMKVVKSGVLEKNVPHAKLLWARRMIVIRPGELSYYLESEEEQQGALNIIRLSEDVLAINVDDSSGFTVATTKDSFKFRLPENSASLPCVIEQMRDDWINAIKHACKRVNDGYDSEVTGSTSGSFAGDSDVTSQILDKLQQLEREVEKLQTPANGTFVQNITSIQAIIASMQNDMNAKLVRSRTISDASKPRPLNIVPEVVIEERPNSGENCFNGDNKDKFIQSISPMINELPPPPEEQITDFSMNIDFGNPLADEIIQKIGPNLQPSDDKIEHSIHPPSPTERLPSPPPPAQFSGAPEVNAYPIEDTVDGELRIIPDKEESNVSNDEQLNASPTSPPTSNGDLDRPVIEQPQPTSPPPGSMPPPPPPPILTNGGPPPPPPPGLFPPPPPSSNHSTPRSKGTSMRPIHWTVVPKTLMSKSFWDGAKDLQSEIDSDKLLEMFKATGNKKDDDTLKNEKTPRKKAAETLLDLKTAQNLGIFMAGFKIRGDDLVQKLTILKQENGGLSTEHLEGLRKFCPEPDMKDLLLKSKENELAKVDQFMLELCLVPKVTIRLDILYTIREIPMQMETLQPEIDAALKACDQLMNSATFEGVLTYVLAVINAINATNNKGTVKGIRIATLQKVYQDLKLTCDSFQAHVSIQFPTYTTRTNDRRHTLLHAIVSEIKRLDPSMLKLTDELADFTKIQLFSTKALFAEIDVLRKDVLKCKKNSEVLKRKKNKPTSQDIEFCKEVETTLSQYEDEIGFMNERCHKTKQAFGKILSKFGEPPESDSQEIFKIIQEFLINFKKESITV